MLKGWQDNRELFPLYRMNLFLGQPCGIFDGLLYILSLQVRVFIQYFIKEGAMGNLPYNDGYGNSHTPNTSASSHNIR